MWRDEKKLIQNMTGRKKFNSKSDKTKKILVENHASYKNFFIQNHAF